MNKLLLEMMLVVVVSLIGVNGESSAPKRPANLTDMKCIGILADLYDKIDIHESIKICKKESKSSEVFLWSCLKFENRIDFTDSEYPCLEEFYQGKRNLYESLMKNLSHNYTNLMAARDCCKRLTWNKILVSSR